MNDSQFPFGRKKICTHCHMWVPMEAKKCPYCLSNPNDGLEKWYAFWYSPTGIIVAILITVLCIGAPFCIPYIL